MKFLSLNRTEKTVLLLISLTFFIGLWHGAPITNVVADEMFFSGAVLRALDSHTIFPLPLDVPYGTITYYFSYLFISVGLGILWVFKLFDIDALRLLIIEYPFIVYFTSRLVSSVIALILLFGIYHVLKPYITDYRTRLVLVFLLFSTLLINVLLHTSKVWILSTLLMLVSFYFLVRVVEGIFIETKKRDIWICVISAFLSFANFPLMGLSLVCLPILGYVMRSDREGRQLLWKVTAWGILLALFIILSNFSGIKAQVWSIIYDYSFSPNALEHNASIFLSAYLHMKKIIFMFPLLVAFVAYSAIISKVKNRKLFLLSTAYTLVYIVAIILVDRWSLTDKAALRYLFPVPFFFAFIIASFDIPYRRVFLLPVFISVIYLAPTLYYLSVPTTSHGAVRYVEETYRDDEKAVFINHVGADTPLPQNKSSYLLAKEIECGSKCRATIERDLNNDFKPMVIDAHTETAKFDAAQIGKDVYLVERAASSSPELVLVAKFTNPVEDLNYYSLDNTGSYFDPAYFGLSRYGPNIYIYKMR
ncbi:MAG: hypothetical protein WCV79_02005 [Candidatus Paceibacterota bacterium]